MTLTKEENWNEIFRKVNITKTEEALDLLQGLGKYANPPRLLVHSRFGFGFGDDNFLPLLLKVVEKDDCILEVRYNPFDKTWLWSKRRWGRLSRAVSSRPCNLEHILKTANKFIKENEIKF